MVLRFRGIVEGPQRLLVRCLQGRVRRDYPWADLGNGCQLRVAGEELSRVRPLQHEERVFPMSRRMAPKGRGRGGGSENQKNWRWLVDLGYAWEPVVVRFNAKQLI